MKPLRDMTITELATYRAEVQRQWDESHERYHKRYSGNNAGYAARINDDYNGEGEEFTQLTFLLGKIKEEIRRRMSES